MVNFILDILIIDDCKTVQQMLKLMLSHTDDIRVTGVAGSAEAAFQEIAKHEPTIVTLDLSLPDADGLDVLDRLLGNQDWHMQVIVLSGTQGQEAIALAHGAFACFEKASLLHQADRFIQTIRDAAACPRIAPPFHPATLTRAHHNFR